MNTLAQNRAERIAQLHRKAEGHVRATIQAAIEIGGLLKEQKRELPHGEWGRWVQQNLPFTIRTAQNYMRLYEHRAELKNENVSFLTDAYERLAAPSEAPALHETRLHQYAEDVRHLLAHAEAELQAAIAGEARLRELDAALSVRQPEDAHERALIEELQREVREGFDLVEQARECLRDMVADTGQVEGGN